MKTQRVPYLWMGLAMAAILLSAVPLQGFAIAHSSEPVILDNISPNQDFQSPPSLLLAEGDGEEEGGDDEPLILGDE